MNTCQLTKLEQTEIRVRCEPSYDGGLTQRFHLEVLEKHHLNDQSSETGTSSSSSLSSPSSITSLSTFSFVSPTSSPLSNNPQSGSFTEITAASRNNSLLRTKSQLRLIHNLTNAIEPVFVVGQLRSSQEYLLRVYSSNVKGRSRKILQMSVHTLVSNYNQSVNTFRSGKTFVVFIF